MMNREEASLNLHALGPLTTHSNLGFSHGGVPQWHLRTLQARMMDSHVSIYIYPIH